MKKNKQIIDKYNPEIYPRLLYVAKNCTEESINKEFSYRDDSPIVLGRGEYLAMTHPVIHKKTNKLCVLVTLDMQEIKKEPAIKKVGICAHEADHVKHMFAEDIDLHIDYKSQEASAYLVQWATECIYATMTK